LETRNSKIEIRNSKTENVSSICELPASGMYSNFDFRISSFQNVMRIRERWTRFNTD